MNKNLRSGPNFHQLLAEYSNAYIWILAWIFRMSFSTASMSG